MKKKRKTNQRGAILLLVIFLLLIMSVLVISVSLLHRSELEAISSQVDDLKAFYCAESGLENVMYRFRSPAGQPVTPTWPNPPAPNQNQPYNGNPYNPPNQQCIGNAGNALVITGNTWAVNITEVKADSQEGTVYRYVWVTSTGTVKSSGYRRTIRALVHRSMTYQNAPGAQSVYFTQYLRYEAL